MRAGIEPGIAAAEAIHGQIAAIEIGADHIGDLELAALRGLQGAGDRGHVAVEEIETGDCPARCGVGGLLDDIRGAAGLGIEADHPVTLGILDLIGENRRAAGRRRCRGHVAFRAHRVAMEDIVAEDQRRGAAGEEFLADQEGLGEPLGLRLHRIAQVDPERDTGPQQRLEHRQVARGGDDQDVADARQHQYRERVIDHRLVEHGQELFRDRQRRRIEPRARSTGEDDALHAVWLRPAITAAAEMT